MTTDDTPNPRPEDPHPDTRAAFRCVTCGRSDVDDTAAECPTLRLFRRTREERAADLAPKAEAASRPKPDGDSPLAGVAELFRRRGIEPPDWLLS